MYFTNGNNYLGYWLNIQLFANEFNNIETLMISEKSIK